MPDIRMPDGQVVRFPDTMSEQQIRGLIASKYPREVGAANSAGPSTGTPQGHYAFDGSDIPRYDPETGMVDSSGPRATLPRTTATVMSAVEGLPVVGPYARQGVEAASAGIGSALTGQPYEQVRSEIQGMTDQATADHPYFSTGGKIGGAVLGTLPMVMAAPGLFGASAGPAGAGLLGRTLMSTASGAGLGGADAGVRSGGDIGATLTGMLYGGAAGAASPVLGEVVGAGARYVGSRFGGSPAQKAFSQAAGADAIDDVSASLAQMGDDALPMDLGPGLRSQAGAIANRPGPAQQVVRSALSGRQQAAGGRVAGALDAALGQKTDTLALADDIIAKRSAAAKPLYDAAYSKPVPFTRDLETLLTRPSVGKALSKAKTLAADEGISSQQWFANIADDGAVTIKNVPDVRQLDLTKRALDDMISAAQRAGNNNEARILTQSKNQLLSMIDDAVPEYSQARAAFSGPTAVLDAMEEGQKAFSNSLTPSQLKTRLLKMGEAEKEAYIQGARAQVANIMGTARNDALAARSAFQKGYNKEKLGLLIGDDQANQLLRSLDAETAFAETNREITQQSITAGRQQANKTLDASSEPGLLRELDVTKPLATFGRIGDRIAGGTRAQVQDGINEELARLLTSRDGASLTRVIKTVQAAQKRGDISAQRAKEIIQSTMLGGHLPIRKPLEISAGTPAR